MVRGVAHLRGHETDRLAALATEINGLGGDVTETEDGLRIRPRPLHGGVSTPTTTTGWPPPARCSGCACRACVVEDVATTAKTLPDFAGLWRGMLDGDRHAVVPPR